MFNQFKQLFNKILHPLILWKKINDFDMVCEFANDILPLKKGMKLSIFLKEYNIKYAYVYKDLMKT